VSGEQSVESWALQGRVPVDNGMTTEAEESPLVKTENSNAGVTVNCKVCRLAIAL
jgi:hypothetical protein